MSDIFSADDLQREQGCQPLATVGRQPHLFYSNEGRGMAALRRTKGAADDPSRVACAGSTGVD